MKVPKGTANAIYQNINLFRRYRPDYVVRVHQGDHIYKMDYSKMVAFTKSITQHVPLRK
ncbi:MAG: sugar phosphate nucleotidyltransferase [Eubacteriales bacterium]